MRPRKSAFIPQKTVTKQLGFDRHQFLAGRFNSADGTKRLSTQHNARNVHRALAHGGGVLSACSYNTPSKFGLVTHTRGLLRRMTINGGLQHCIGKEVLHFEQGKDDFIENIDDVCIHYDRGRAVANESLITEISKRGLRKTTKQTGLDRKTIRAILKGEKVKG